MTSKIYVGRRRDVPNEWSHPINVGCSGCSLITSLLISPDEYPLDWTRGQRAVVTMFLRMKYPDSHDCGEWQ